MNVWIRSLLLFFSLFSAGISNGENVDSIKYMLLENSNDSIAIELYIKLANSLVGNDNQLCLEYARTAYRKADSLKRNDALARSCNILGGAYLNLGMLDKSIQYYLQSLNINERLGKNRDICANLNNLALAYRQNNMLNASLKMFERAQVIAEEEDLKSFLPGIFNNIGILYTTKENYDSALLFYHKALNINKTNTNVSSIVLNLVNISDVLRIQTKYEEAKKLATEALYLSDSLRDKNLQSLSVGNLGLIAMETGAYIDAERLMNRALQLSIEISNRQTRLILYDNLMNIYQELRAYDRLYDTYKKYKSLKDSLFNEQNSLQIANMHIAYETEKKGQEILYLGKLNEEKQTQIYLGWMSSTLVLLVGISFLYFVRQRHLKNKLILEQKNELLKKDNEVQRIRLNAALEEISLKENDLKNYLSLLSAKNDFIENIKQKIEILQKNSPATEDSRFEVIKELSTFVILTDQDWIIFKEKFDLAFPGLIFRLKEKINNLTKADLRIFMLLKLQLDIKEIAKIAAISPDSVRISKMRLKRKLDLNSESELLQFISEFK